MKQKLTALVLSLTMVASMIPAVGAAAPDDFETRVTLPILEVRTSGLYDEPEEALPAPAEVGFMREIEGWTPAELSEGLPVAKLEADASAVEISTVEQLQALTAGSYILTKDIDLTGVAWTPLTIKGSLILDGQGYTIRGLNVTSETTSVSGLLGRVEGDLTVQNLCWEDISLTTDCAVSTGEGFARGTLASMVNGAVKLQNFAARNVNIIRANTQGKNLGGIVGSAKSLTAEDCFVEVTVQRDPAWLGTEEGGCSAIGGVLGDGRCEAVRCYLSVDIDSENALGAVVGGLVGNGNLSAKDCMVIGGLNSDSDCVGGLSGFSGGTTYNNIYPVVENCVVQAELASKNAAGGMIGRTNKADVKISDSRYVGTITMEEGGTVSAGGMIGFLRGSLQADGCAADVDLVTVNQSQSAPTLNGRAGGMIGHTESASYTLTRCAADVSDQGMNTVDMVVGGLVGSYQYASDGVIRDCFANLEIPKFKLVSGNLTVGGLVGNANGIVVTNCGANLKLSVENTVRTGDGVFGGLIGYVASSAQIARSYAAGSIDAIWAGDVNETLDAGGLVGSCYTHVPISIGQCYGGVDVSAMFRDGVNACSVGGLIGNGENCMVYSAWSDARVETSVPEEMETQYGKGHQGGLIGYGRGTVMDSCFVGELSGIVMGYAGGLAGEGVTTIHNCYVETDLPGGGTTGGLVGASGTVRYSDCRFDGTIEQTWGTTGGILGDGDGTIAHCNSNGDIDALNQAAGGIAGIFGGTITDCEFSGSVAGYKVGGIAGEANTVNHCTVSGDVAIHADKNAMNCFLGGIVGKGRWIDDCHVRRFLNVDFSIPETDGHYQDMGGIAGATDRAFGRGAVTNCSGAGISVYITDSDVNLNLGGIVGEAGDEMDFENCRVSGPVRGTNPIGYIYVGGIAGKGYDSNVKKCTVSSSVYGYISDPKKGEGPVFTGSIMGWGSWGVMLDGVNCGRGSGGAANPNVEIRKDSPEIGVGVLNKENVPAADTSSREEESYTIRTYWYPEMSLSMLPLAGATVSVNGIARGVTKADGSLVLDGSAVPGGIVKISAKAEGYFAAETVTALAKGGTTNLYLEKKTSGKIYLTTALIETEPEEMQEMLYSKNSVNVLLNEKEMQHFYFGVDWNDTQIEGRKLELVDKDGNIRTEVGDNADIYFRLPRYFEPEEEIYLKASGLKPDGTETVNQVLLPLKVKMVVPNGDLHSEQAPLGPTDVLEGLDFLDGVSFGIDFGNMFWGYGGEITYKNQVLKIDFNRGRSEDLNKAKGLINGKTKVSVGGKVEIVMKDPEKTEYSGEIKVDAKLDPLFEHKRLLFMVGPVPVSATSKIDIGTSAGLGIEGMFDDPKFSGRMGVEGGAEIIVGAGGSVDLLGNMVQDEEDDDLEVILGPSIGAEGGFDVFLEPFEESGGHIEAKLEGDLSFKLQAKAGGFVDIDPSVQIGAFSWNNKEGAKFTSALVNDDENHYGGNGAGGGGGGGGHGGRTIQWVPNSQSYLTAGGGFCTDAMENLAILHGWNQTPVEDEVQANVAQLYENVAQGSTAVLAVEGENLVLYFTADDGSRELEGNAVDHTAVWRTVRGADGNWSEPVIISGSENGYPDHVRADGPAAVWVESTQTGSLEELLTSTRIKVAVNGEVFHTVETDGYVYGPKISAADDGSNILVSWFSAPEVNSLETMLAAVPRLCYARYADGKWSQGEVNTGDSVPVSAAPVYADPCIVWTNTEGQNYHSTRTDFSRLTARMTDVNHAAYNGSYTAEMEADGRLIIWNDTSQEAELRTGASGFEAPLLLDGENGVCYAVWMETDGVYYADSASNWAYAKPICALDQQVMGLSGTIVGGLPVVTWYETEYNEDKTDFIYHLYFAQAPDMSGVDLAVQKVTLDDSNVGLTGLTMVSAEVVNQLEQQVTEYTYTVTDETGKALFTGTKSELSMGYGAVDYCHALIAADVAQQHTYTVTVTAEGDMNSENNGNSAATVSEPELTGVMFRLMPTGEIGLESMVTNSGSAPAEELTVEIYRCSPNGSRMGDVLVSEQLENLYAGSYRQVILEEVTVDTLYKVVLSSDGTQLDSEMLMLSDPELSGAWITGVNVDTAGKAEVHLSAQNWAEDLVLQMAVYQDGRMVANAMETLSAWTGSKNLDFDFAEELENGTYTYSAFLLKRDGLVPVTKKLSGSVNISE